MRYGIVVLEGAAGEPVEELDGLTALEAATTPNLDRLAALGRVGCVALAPPGLESFASMRIAALLGRDSSRGGFEPGPTIAAAHGVDLDEGAPAVAVRLLCAGDNEDGGGDGVVLDAHPRGLTAPEARSLFERLDRAWVDRPEGARLVHCGGAVGVLTNPGAGLAEAAATCVAPERLLRRPWRRLRPKGDAARTLRTVTDSFAEALREDGVNRARRESGLRPINAAWLYGTGRNGDSGAAFEERWGLRGAFVGTSDEAAGAARLLGLERVAAPGATGDESSDLAAKGRYAVGALDRYGLVVVHVAGAAEAAARGDWQARMRSIEAADAHVVGPLLACLESHNDEGGDDARGWRMLVVADRTPDAEGVVEPSPFALAGAWVRGVLTLRADERGAQESDLFVDRGFDLLEYTLRSGLKHTTIVTRPRAAGVTRRADHHG